MIPANTFNIPNFIKASTPELLMSLMLKQNAKTGRENKYFDISFVDGFWYAWYYTDVSSTVTLKGMKR